MKLPRKLGKMCFFTHYHFSAVFIKLRKFLIADCLHTDDTEGHGGPQADEVGERQLSKIGQQLKEKFVCQRRTRRKTDGGPQADGGEQVLIKDYSHIICFQRCSSSYASS